MLCIRPATYIRLIVDRLEISQERRVGLIRPYEYLSIVLQPDMMPACGVLVKMFVKLCSRVYVFIS